MTWNIEKENKTLVDPNTGKPFESKMTWIGDGHKVALMNDANDISNAALISAAPDLLLALEQLLMEIEAQKIHAPARIAFAKKAIEKAEAKS